MTADRKTIPSVSLSEGPPHAAGGQASTRSEVLPGNGSVTHGTIWLLRVRALLLVTVCATFGVLLIILPWTPKWTDNRLLLASPQLRQIVANGFVRGVCSGLGILDLWLGFWEAIYYHEKPVASD